MSAPTTTSNAPTRRISTRTNRQCDLSGMDDLPSLCVTRGLRSRGHAPRTTVCASRYFQTNRIPNGHLSSVFLFSLRGRQNIVLSVPQTLPSAGRECLDIDQRRARYASGRPGCSGCNATEILICINIQVCRSPIMHCSINTADLSPHDNDLNTDGESPARIAAVRRPGRGSPRADRSRRERGQRAPWNLDLPAWRCLPGPLYRD